MRIYEHVISGTLRPQRRAWQQARLVIAIIAALSAVAVPAIVAGAGSAAAGQAPVFTSAPTATLNVTNLAAIGVEGTDGQLWAQAPQLGAAGFARVAPHGTSTRRFGPRPQSSRSAEAR